jgi:hypothetical protein
MASSQLVSSAAIGAGGTQAVDFDTRRQSVLTVVWVLSGSSTPADLTPAVFPYAPNGTTVLGVDVPAEALTAPVVDSALGGVLAARRYDVSGIEKVRIRTTNNNAGALSYSLFAYAEYGGRG